MLDWEWLYYLGTVILRMNEEQFWKCTLRKLYALWKVHKEVNGLDIKQNKKNDRGYIDDVL